MRPSSGSLDLDAITTWLAAKDYAFLDSVVGTTWHLSATAEEMKESRRKHLANPKSPMPPGVLVHIQPEFVGMTLHHPHLAEAKALEFVSWLVSKGDWNVQLDQSPWEPVGDPARLFSEGAGETDHTIDELTEGVRHTWRTNERSFIVHSIGQWRTQLRDATEKWRVLESWHGELSPSAMTEWEAAVTSAGALDEYVAGNEPTGSFEVEDLEGIEKAWFDSSDVPAPLNPIGALVERWVGELARWNDAGTSTDLLRVRKG